MDNSAFQEYTKQKIEIQYERGTLLVYCSGDEELLRRFDWLRWDKRSKCHRCHAHRYNELIRFLYPNTEYIDSAKQYNKLELLLNTSMKPYQFQSEAIEAWRPKKQGIAVLPTGTGKSYLAAMIMERVQRSTLVLAPTIDLILQWQRNLEEWFQCPIGLLGGGSFDLQEITVSTYDSARIQAENLGNRFCLLIFDECHHLPAPAYSQMAQAYIAPYRLGLTATPNHELDRHHTLLDLIGPIVYSRQINQLSGDFLAPYQVETIEVALTPEERNSYDHHREIYLNYRDRYRNYLAEKIRGSDLLCTAIDRPKVETPFAVLRSKNRYPFPLKAK